MSQIIIPKHLDDLMIKIGDIPAYVDRANNIISYVAGMTIDADGGAHTYHPANIGTDDLKNAKNSRGAWVGLVTVNGAPYIAPSGYYISSTSYQRKGKSVCDPARYLDAETVPFIAVPPQLIKAVKPIVIGSRVIVRNQRNGRQCLAVVGDVGPTYHLGEGSVALANALGIKSDPRTGGIENPVIEYEIHAGIAAVINGETFRAAGGMIYVDPLLPCIRNRNWHHDESCHLMCDPCENFDELHKFAQSIGLKRCWFQNKKGSTPHYDLTAGKRAEAVRAGAIEIDRSKSVEIIRAWRAYRSPQMTQPALL